MNVKLTIADTVTNLLTIVALYHRTLLFDLLLRAGALSVAKLVTVATLGHQAVNRLTGILQAN